LRIMNAEIWEASLGGRWGSDLAGVVVPAGDRGGFHRVR